MVSPRMNYIFVDFENIPDIDLGGIAGKPIKVILVIGERQTKLSLALVKQLHQLHEQVALVEVGSAGKNALDFVLAHHVGLYCAKDPHGFFHILSRDKGFDALVLHLKSQSRLASRSESLSAIPALIDVKSLTTAQRVEIIFQKLASMKTGGRPAKLKTLASMIHGHFHKLLTEADTAAVIESLRKSGHLSITPKQTIDYKI